MHSTNPIPVECVAVIGLGYVGLSLASAFGRVIPTIGFDIDQDRIRELRDGHDRRGEASPDLLHPPHLSLSNDPGILIGADFLIVTVPTPVDRAKRPDLSHLIGASRLIGRILKAKYRRETGDGRPESRIPTPNTQHPTSKTRRPIIVYESTVYPGCTEEVCVPVLEQESGLTAGEHFKVGYSPERINPGDPEHTLETIVKVVAGQDDQTAEAVERVYSLVVRGGVYRAPDIRTAEAAKVIENIQRDLNIALMNELAMLFHRMDLDIHEVLKAARTKWNFLPFEPGLVGGHCIPVDPYYLTHKAQEIGYHPEVILAGRRINDSMGIHIAREMVKLLIRAGKVIQGAKVLVLGVTFKENVRDVRNSRVVDLVRELENHGIGVDVYDPVADPTDLHRLGLKDVPDPFQSKRPVAPSSPGYDGVVLAVPHTTFRAIPREGYVRLLSTMGGPGVLVDVKGIWQGQGPRGDVLYWSL
jgi:UDP-N-acetyl-D-glucosamine/UDP-N-acetyl-D-galactosamine dehydrogenase